MLVTPVYFLSRFPNAYVIAIEPDPDNFAILKHNLAPYKGRCHAVLSAVWSRPTRLVVSRQSGNRKESSRSVREGRVSEEPALMGTDIGTLLLDSGYARISILKVDKKVQKPRFFLPTISIGSKK